MRWRIKYTYDLQRRYWKLLEETADRIRQKKQRQKTGIFKRRQKQPAFAAVHIKWNKCWWFVCSAVGGVPPHDQGSSHDVFYVDGVDDDDHCNGIRNLTELNMSTNEFFRLQMLHRHCVHADIRKKGDQTYTYYQPKANLKSWHPKLFICSL